MKFKVCLLMPIILIVYFFVMIFDNLKRWFEKIGDKLVDIAFEIK